MKFMIQLIAMLFLAMPCLGGSASVDLSCGLHVEYSDPDIIWLGSNGQWKVVASNTSTNDIFCALLLQICCAVDGRLTNDIYLKSSNLNLTPGSSNVVEYTLFASNYFNWFWRTNAFQSVASIRLVPAIPLPTWEKVSGTHIEASSYSFLQVTPTNPVVGNVVTAKVYHINPYPIEIHNVEVSFQADINGSEKLPDVVFQLGTIATNGYINAETNFIVNQTGTLSVISTVTATESIDTGTDSVQMNVGE